MTTGDIWKPITLRMFEHFEGEMWYNEPNRITRNGSATNTAVRSKSTQESLPHEHLK